MSGFNCELCGGALVKAVPFFDGHIRQPDPIPTHAGDRPKYGLPKGGNFYLCATCKSDPWEAHAAKNGAPQGWTSMRAASPDVTLRTSPPKPAPAPITAVAPLSLPLRIFTSRRLMDDMTAPDMKYKDIPADALRNFYGLRDVSTRLDPYAMADRKASAAILFDEFRELSDLFSFYGPTQGVMRQMITHMQGNSGGRFTHPQLDSAMKARILSGEDNDTLQIIKTVLAGNINWEAGCYPLLKKDQLLNELLNSRLPKFNSWADRVNGLGITVHDTWATHITLQSLEVSGGRFKAQVHYRIQDHFGLDDADVRSPFYRQFRIFRIWYMLQHWTEFGYRPFVTEMNTTITIEGSRGG